MQTICEMDVSGIWAGASRRIGDKDGAPPGWVFADPPDVPAGKIARWLGTWSIEAAPAPPPEPVPDEVADWQFAGQAAAESYISQDEALAWAARGEIPKTLDDALAGVVTDPDALFEARLILSGAKSYRRDSPLVPLLGAVFRKNEAGLDQFWRDAAKRGV